MKILLIYYTGTYNTRFLSNKLKNKLLDKGHTVDLLEINCDSKIVDTTSYDLIGLGYPIYGFNSPLPFNKYIRKLKFKKNQKYFIYKNSGETLEFNNASSRVLLRILKRKAKCIGEYHFVMPYTIRFGYDKDFVKEILVKDNKLMDIMIYNLEHQNIKNIKSNLIYDITSIVLSIQKVGGPINSFFYKVDNEKCIKCQKCIEACPENNIYMKDGEIKFHHNCDMCMRCSFYCPADAIKIGMLNHWRVNGDYNLSELEKEKIDNPYITDESSGFYKCFIKTFKEIDDEYDRLFNNNV